ncbi:MAG: cytochrome c biogenesis protein [Candidatus Omnitrophota bacterium]
MKAPGVFLRILLAAAIALPLCAFSTKSLPGERAKIIPIQHNGRVKCFDAFARQTLKLITEKETWNGKPAYSVILTALHKEGALANMPWIKINNRELVSHLGMPSDRDFFSYNEILPSADKVESLIRSAKTRRDQDVRPSMLEQKAETLFAALIEVKELMSGKALRVIPPASGEIWFSPYEGPAQSSNQFRKMVRLFGQEKYPEFDMEVKTWVAGIHDLTGNRFKQKVDLEVHYLGLKPFEGAWVLYVSAFLCLGVLRRFSFWSLPGALLLFAAFLAHTYGLLLRVLILSRPPVSNMYESMVFMNWVVMLTALVFSVVRKNAMIAAIGALVSAVIMIYGSLLPIDPSLDVLVPVLRSNYWLTIHVLTIVSSYGVFGLAMGLGHWHLFREMRGKLTSEDAEQSAQLIYRVIQVGVLLLGIGTTLGGVWANESWGRFWGWDPKETWALITFLGYLVVIHLKMTKILKPFALAVSAILGFLFVLMTWYGVNFVLGRGLHSYGQGAGGMIWVTYYLIFEALFLGLAISSSVRKARPG